MALSKSFQKGQTVLACQMCEEESKIKWKCLLCNLLICDKCRKIHEKFKSSEEHKIVDLKNIASEQKQLEQIHDFNNIKCDRHVGKICCLFCTECEEVVCPLCITNAHNTHKMIEVSEGFNNFMEVLTDLHASTNQDLSLLTTNMETLQKMKTEGLLSYTEEKQAIQNQEKVLKDTIHEQSENLQSQLDDRVNNMIKLLEADENKTKENFRAIELKSTFLKDVIDSKDMIKVFKTAAKETIEKGEIRLIDVTKYKGLPNFVPGCIKQQTITSMYGRLEEIQFNPKFEVSRTFKTTFPHIQCMVCTNGSMWISNYTSKSIQHISFLQDGHMVLKTINVSHVERMQLSNSGDLFLSCHVSTLYMFQPETVKVIPTKYTAAPLITTGAFEISKNNKIIVGAREGGPAFPPNGARKVIVMNMEGEHEITYYLDHESKPIFTLPFRITTDNNYDIYVGDVFNHEYEGRVIKLNPRGGISGVYMGHPEINDSDHPLIIADLKSISSYNVVVPDDKNGILHILDSNVQCIHFVRTKELGIARPLSLEIDNDSIFITCKSEIYEVNFSGV